LDLCETEHSFLHYCFDIPIMKELVCDYLTKEVTINGRKLNVSSTVLN